MLQATSRYSYLGLFFGIAVVLGFFGGRWLDRRWHTDPWLSMAGLLVGVAAGFRELYRLSKRALEDEKKS
ncbi:MAG TPA: AtpZ/AtpI family protein [Polyangia bacterium]|nr:AtpZ/AtpI family protein [Polyangia bacterium]